MQIFQVSEKRLRLKTQPTKVRDLIKTEESNMNI